MRSILWKISLRLRLWIIINNKPVYQKTGFTLLMPNHSFLEVF
jgi:hypothetical protein